MALLLLLLHLSLVGLARGAWVQDTMTIPLASFELGAPAAAAG